MKNKTVKIPVPEMFYLIFAAALAVFIGPHFWPAWVIAGVVIVIAVLLIMVDLTEQKQKESRK